MINPLPKALFDASLSFYLADSKTVSLAQAEEIFTFFKTCKLFRWSDAQNDCEDRAHAICMLLDAWNIPNYKGWVFSGAYLKNTTGSLINLWNYHVATALPVAIGDYVVPYIIDPSILNEPASLYQWAHNITNDECSYYLVRKNEEYIFCPPVITNDNWHKSNRQNYQWMLQGLAGVNGVTSKGKAQLVFCKKKIAETKKQFLDLMRNNPF